MAELKCFAMVRELLHMIANVRIPADLARKNLAFITSNLPKLKIPFFCGYLHNDSEMARISALKFSRSRRDNSKRRLF